MTPVDQFRIFMVRPILQFIDLHSVAAEDLIVGTAVHESGNLRFFEQVTGKDDHTLGPALGFFQMERLTHDSLWNDFLRYRGDLAERIKELLATYPDRHLQLCTNIAYGAAMCRIKYFQAKDKLPAAGDIDAYAAYWKKIYNSPSGAGTPAQWALAYRANCTMK